MLSSWRSKKERWKFAYLDTRSLLPKIAESHRSLLIKMYYSMLKQVRKTFRLQKWISPATSFWLTRILITLQYYRQWWMLLLLIEHRLCKFMPCRPRLMRWNCIRFNNVICPDVLKISSLGAPFIHFLISVSSCSWQASTLRCCQRFTQSGCDRGRITESSPGI